MASIEVALAGLMLICLKGQTQCPTKASVNTAWVIASQGTPVCDWAPGALTLTLVVQFKTADFKAIECDAVGEDTRCSLPPRGDICIEPNAGSLDANDIDPATFQGLPNFYDIDKRFHSIEQRYLDEFAPQNVRFLPGKISHGSLWRTDIKWLRSSLLPGGSLPSPLSDQLLVKYDGAEVISFKNCSGGELLRLERIATSPRLTVRNRASFGPPVVAEGSYYKLPFLLWYYRLANWGAGTDLCPDQISAVLLACKGEKDSLPCACTANCDADSTYWPPFLRPDR